MEFSPNVINRYVGRCEDEQHEIEVTDNQVGKEITTKQVVQWPRKGKLSAGELSVKYAIFHTIDASNWVPDIVFTTSCLHGHMSQILS